MSDDFPLKRDEKGKIQIPTREEINLLYVERDPRPLLGGNQQRGRRAAGVINKLKMKPKRIQLVDAQQMAKEFPDTFEGPFPF